MKPFFQKAADSNVFYDDDIMDQAMLSPVQTVPWNRKQSRCTASVTQHQI